MFILTQKKRRKTEPRRKKGSQKETECNIKYRKRFACSYCMNEPKLGRRVKEHHYLGGGEAFLDSGSGERPRLDTPAGLAKPF